ncbi:MAG: tripartite tricarboxylate transporter substrate-binding protein [Candidatus Binatia bacterium]
MPKLSIQTSRAILIIQGFVALLAIVVWNQTSSAQGSFYQGKTVNIIVGYPAGTTHDIWARMIAQYMPKHLDGAPNFVVQPMPGAGSMVSANYIYSVAKPDGLTLATFNAALYFNQLVGREEVKFDWPKLSWIGSSTPATRLFYIRADSPLKTIEDFRKTSAPPKCGATGRSSTGYLLPKLLEETLGMKFSIVTGYPGGGEIDLAIEKGEIECNSTSLSVFFGREPFHSWRKKSFVRVLLQTGRARDPRLPNVPTIAEIMDQYQTPEPSRRLANVFLDAGRFGSWPMVAPPGIPKDQIQSLRAAFAKTLADPNFLDEANKKKLEVELISGEELQGLAKAVMDQPPDVAQRLQKLLGK